MRDYTKSISFALVQVIFGNGFLIVKWQRRKLSRAKRLSGCCAALLLIYIQLNSSWIVVCFCLVVDFPPINILKLKTNITQISGKCPNFPRLVYYF